MVKKSHQTKASSVKRCDKTSMKTPRAKKTAKIVGVGVWIIRRKTLGYGELPEESVFPFAFATKKLAQSMMKELGECACESAKSFTQDDYRLRKHGALALEVYSPEAVKDWYSQSFLIEESTDGGLQLVESDEGVPYDQVYEWASPKLKDEPKTGQVKKASGNWELLGFKEWAVILAKRPELKDRINIAKCFDANWPKLSAPGLTELLEACPDLIDRVAAEARPVLDAVSGWDEILSKNPQLFEYCKELGYCDKWGKNGGRWWYMLLSVQPQFADLCDWRQLGVYDWKDLLVDQPQFLDRCREVGMLDEVLEASTRSSEFWESIIPECPKLIERCPPDRLDRGVFEELVKRNPKAAHKVIDRFDANELRWAAIISIDPTFVEDCGDKFEIDDWVDILVERPELTKKFNDWNALSIDNWVVVLREHPELAKRFNDWGGLSSDNWVDLLCSQPQFADKCDCWKDLSVKNWRRLLCSQEQFAKKCTCWNEFSERQWCSILINTPTLSGKCKSWNTFSTQSWVELLMEQPQFADKCNFAFETYTVYGNKRNPWRELLAKRPEFADKCDWREVEWSFECPLLFLLEEQPLLSNRCDWTKLKLDRQKWERQVVRYRPGMAVLIAKHLDKRMQSKLITIEDWAVLLAEDPSMDELFSSAKIIKR